LLSSNISSRCPYNIVNFGPLTAEIDWRVWGTPSCFNGYRVCSDTARQSSSGCQPNFVALNRGRHLYSTGRPSRWALAHILVNNFSRLSMCALIAKIEPDKVCFASQNGYYLRPVFLASRMQHVSDLHSKFALS